MKTDRQNNLLNLNFAIFQKSIHKARKFFDYPFHIIMLILILLVLIKIFIKCITIRCNNKNIYPLFIGQKEVIIYIFPPIINFKFKKK